MRRLMLVSVVALISGLNAAHADTLFNNITASPYSGNCVFSTTCAATFDSGNVYGAQSFSLERAATLTSGSFAEFDFETGPIAANWMISAANGNVPGTTLFSGSSDVSKISAIGSKYGYRIAQVDFDLGNIQLGAGSYFFAVQAVSPSFYNYLANGVSEGGAAETRDGGASWSTGYENMGSVGVALSGTSLSAVPLPASAPMFGAALLALGGFGYSVRRRKAAATPAA